MANNSRGWLCAVGAAALLAVPAAIAPPASAQGTGLQASSDAAKSVDLRTAPEVPAVALPAGLAINRPTMPMADYVAAKNAAAARVGGSRPQSAAAPPPATGVTLFTQVGSTNESQTTGGNRFPPDGDVATSATWMVQVNNDIIVMYNWLNNAFVSKNFATFFQDGIHALFHPRVIYDPYWDRFVVLADACDLCSGMGNTSFFKLAVSHTGDPSGAWIVYNVGIGAAMGDFADFPQLGMDLNSIIFTYNDFLADGGFEARTFAVAKAYLYNGLSFGVVPVFGGSACTNAPPYVLDNSGVDYIVAFCPGDNKVYIGSLRDTGLSTVSINLWDNTVAVGSLSGLPPNAPQPGVNYPLDTGDNRFENRSLQVGSRILNTATILDGTATAAWYDFNIGVSPHTLQAGGIWFATGTSSDWHPAINANTIGAGASPVGEIFGTWMSVDATNNVNVQLRAIGGAADLAGSGAGITVYTSPLPLTNQTDGGGIHRSGAYSYIALYPAAALGCASPGEIGILEGEIATGMAGLWGTRIGIVKHC